MKLFFSLFFQLLIGCNVHNKGKMTIRDIEIFRNTPSWDLAQAVEVEDVSKIKEILKNDTSLFNYQEPLYGATVLMRACGIRKWRSAKQLLESGVNPDIVSKEGTTALFVAIQDPWYARLPDTDPKFVQLLLEHKANPNINFYPPKRKGYSGPVEYGTSPLMFSILWGFQKTKLLLEAGANLNYKTELGKTAASESLLMEEVDAAYYLIAEKKADVSQPYFYTEIGNDSIIEKDKPHYPIDLLLDWIPEIGSEKYRKKMAIVQEFKNQGIDYFERKKKIEQRKLDQIKKLHPNDWEEYLKKY